MVRLLHQFQRPVHLFRIHHFLASIQILHRIPKHLSKQRRERSFPLRLFSPLQAIHKLLLKLFKIQISHALNQDQNTALFHTDQCRQLRLISRLGRQFWAAL